MYRRAIYLHRLRKLLISWRVVEQLKTAFHIPGIYFFNNGLRQSYPAIAPVRAHRSKAPLRPGPHLGEACGPQAASKLPDQSEQLAQLGRGRQPVA